jgi:hypothetical protein
MPIVAAAGQSLQLAAALRRFADKMEAALPHCRKRDHPITMT